MPVSRQPVVKHLVVLKEAGLVAGERRRQEVRYSLVPEPLGMAADWLAGIGARWDEERLREHLAQAPQG